MFFPDEDGSGSVSDQVVVQVSWWIDGLRPGRLRPTYPPVLSRSCIAVGQVGQTQGDCVRSAQNVRTRGGVDLVAGARSKGGFGDSYSARKSCCWRPSRGGCVSCGSGCWSRYWGSRGVWARSVHRQWSGSARAADYRLMTCSCPMWIIPTSLMHPLGRPSYGTRGFQTHPGLDIY